MSGYVDVRNWWGQIRCCIFFFQAEDGIRDLTVTGVQTCALPIFELPDLPAHVADVDPVDVSVAVQVYGGWVRGDAEGHVLPVVERAVVVVLPEPHEIGRASCRERV